LLGIEYLHKNKILHRDIKSSNLFISNDNLKIGDLGIAKLLTNTNALASTQLGTPYYMSPEL
jgi:NIMA (never in mitosis gene a)-related kinase